MATLHCDNSRRCRRFDPSMSKRTRKPVQISQQQPQQQQEEIIKDVDKGLLMLQSSMPVLQELIVPDSSGFEGKKAGEDVDRRQGGDCVTEEEENMTAGVIDDDGKPEKKLAVIVAKKGGDSGGGVKIVEMVGRCVKTLNSLIRARRHHLKNKNVARLS